MPLTIDHQPQNQSVVLHQQAVFGVIVSGLGPFAYRWHKDGVPIANATNDQVLIARAHFRDAGLYSVVVSDTYGGNVTSVNASLTVNYSANDGDFDHSFVLGSAIDGSVGSIAIQPDAKILMAGVFRTVNGAARGNIARLNENGTTDHTFMNGLSGADNAVLALALQSDGKVLIGGHFTTVNGVTRHRIARLHRDGSVDIDFASGFTANGGIQSIAVQDDGKVLIGGFFLSVGGVARNRIARLDHNGNLDTNFLNGLSGANADVYSIAVQSDGKVLVAGEFWLFNDAFHSRIARLNPDGSLDTTFRGWMTGLSGTYHTYVSSVALQSDGRIFIGGNFTLVDNVYRRRIARLNANGSLDTNFVPAEVGGNSEWESVAEVAVQTDGRVVFGGFFTNVNGNPHRSVARLNPDGSLDGSFQDVPFGGYSRVIGLALQHDGNVLVGGDFMLVGGVPRQSIARVTSEGTLDKSFDNGLAGPNREISSVGIQSDGRVLIGGGFTNINGSSRRGIARLNSDGSLDSAYQNGMGGVNGTVYSVAVQSDGTTLIAGEFTLVNGMSRNRIARLLSDGNLDTEFQNGMGGAAGLVRDVTLQSDGKVLIGGAFRMVNGVTRDKIARLNPDGSLDVEFQGGVAGANLGVYSIATDTAGKVFIGGSFALVNGVSRHCVARLHVDGSLDTNFQSLLFDEDGIVFSIAVQSDGKVIIGGSFTNINGVVRNRIARLNADGSLDTTFQDGLSGANSTVRTVAAQNDGNILIGGSFGIVNGVTRSGFARLSSEGAVDEGFQRGPSGVSGAVLSVAVQNDHKLLIGGSFAAVNGVPARSIARLWGSANIPPLMKSVAVSAAGTDLTWYATSNRLYRLQYAGDLSATNWSDVAGDVLATGATASQTDIGIGTANERFYRVLLLP